MPEVRDERSEPLGRALHDLESRLGELPAADAVELLVRLVERLDLSTVGALMAQLPPARRLDYEKHDVDLLVSSSEIEVRLVSVEKEPFTVRWIEDSLQAGDVLYDVGANVGAYSLIAAKATGNRARVFAFEPSPSSFLDLCRNIALNGCSEAVVPLPLALWSETELLVLSSSSFVAGAARHRIDRDPAAREPGAASIVGVRLDHLVERFGIPPPTHVKIDTDGYELEVLLGAESALARTECRSVLVELDREETSRNRRIRELLVEAGLAVQREHPREPSPAFPDPDTRPDVYWTFSRTTAPARRRRRLNRRSRVRPTRIQAAQQRAVVATLAVVTVLFLLFVFLPEELGDRPYDVFGLKF